jgi:hypothetical protein
MSARQTIAWLLMASFLIVSAAAVAQDANQNRTLVITRQPTQVPVIQVNGRSYVGLEALASVVNGSVGFSGSQIALSMPLASTMSAPAAAGVNSAPAPTPASLAPYRAQATTNLRLVSTAVSTDSDRNAYQLLNNEFQNMVKLSNKYVAARANMTYISPDALQNDGLNQRFVACGHTLGATAANGQFVDNGSCN